MKLLGAFGNPSSGFHSAWGLPMWRSYGPHPGRGSSPRGGSCGEAREQPETYEVQQALLPNGGHLPQPRDATVDTETQNSKACKAYAAYTATILVLQVPCAFRGCAYLYIHICRYLCTGVHTYICIHIYMYIFIHTHIHEYICV